MNPLIADNLEAIRALARAFGVARLEAFGSVNTPGWDPATSDIDFLVAYPPGYDFGPWLKRRHQLRRSLEGLLGCKVDLIVSSALRDPSFAQEAARTRQVLYDATDLAQTA
jgi:uncharacterized protein